MSWVKLDDQFFTHSKVIDLSKNAKLLYLAGLTHCASQLTDGLITPGALRVIAATVDVPRDESSTLVATGLWELRDNGWQVHNYHDYQPTRDSALATKQARAEAGSRGGQRSAERRAEANSQANSQAKAEQNSEPGSTPSPSPSPSPSPAQSRTEGPPPAARARKAVAGALHPAIAEYQTRFELLKGRKPARNKAQEGRAVAIWDEQGEETYQRALDGFFGCLDGADVYPKSKGFDLAVFVRQFDTWEGGATQNRAASSRTTSDTRRNGVDPNRTLQDVADEIMARHMPTIGDAL